MLANDASTLDEDTVADCIKALKKLFVIEDLVAWNPNNSQSPSNVTFSV